MTVDFEELLSTVWPDWQIVEPIGINGDATMYKAKRQDIVGLSEAAISVTAIPEELDEIDDLHMSGLSDDAVRLHLEQLVRESVQSIQVMEAVKDDANIQRIDDYKVFRNDETGQWFLLVRMELLMPLRKRLQLAPFTEEDIIRLGLDICSAMEKCHRSNIVHRAIEPESIFISKDGGYKLGNFSRARNLMNLSEKYRGMLHPNYAAPEVYNKIKSYPDIDTYSRMDIYSLGTVMYYLANNRKPPFIPQEKQIVSPAEREAAFERRMSGEPLPGLTQISQETEAVILKACAFRMEERYASAAEMRKALLKLIKPDEAVHQPIKEQSVSKAEAVYGEGRQKPEEQAYPRLISMEELVGKPVQKEQKRFKQGKIILCILLALVMMLVGYGVIHYLLTEQDATPSAGDMVESMADFATKSIAVPGFMNDPVHVSITTDGDNKITSMTVNVSSQLSDRSNACEDAAFINQFIGQTGPFTAGENIDVCAGATETSTAIIMAVNQLQ